MTTPVSLEKEHVHVPGPTLDADRDGCEYPYPPVWVSTRGTATSTADRQHGVWYVPHEVREEFILASIETRDLPVRALLQTHPLFSMSR